MQKSIGIFLMKINKMRNTRVFYEFWHDSKAECERYKNLKLMERARVISDLIIKPVFMLQEKFRDSEGCLRLAIKYEADFAYYDHELGIWVIEEVKGHKTASYNIKKKLFLKVLKDNRDPVYHHYSLHVHSEQRYLQGTIVFRELLV